MNKIHRHKLLVSSRCCLIAFVVILFCSSCERDLDLDLGDAGNKPVLYAFLQPDSSLTLSLSKSVSILSDKRYELYSNATILVRKNGMLLQSLNFPNDNVTFQWPHISFASGDSVSFSVYADGAEIASGETRIPIKVPVESLDTLRVLKKGTNGLFELMMKVRVYFNDPEGESNFYQLVLMNNKVVRLSDGELQAQIDTVKIPKDDVLFYNPEQGSSSFETLDFQGLFSDQGIVQRPYGIVMYLPINLFDAGDDVVENKLVFRLYHLNSLYYSFFRAQIIAASYEGLPVFNSIKAPSNVSNGFGVVTSLACSSDTLVVR